MLALRSLRARLLIIGVVPVVVALAVTAVLAARSDDQRFFQSDPPRSAEANRCNPAKTVFLGCRQLCRRKPRQPLARACRFS